ncbi:MAG: L-rhamnose mutarotase [Actinomycetota bacterium]|nr:L-rhamnose mutarotase [Actinomycetota bacterium]
MTSEVSVRRYCFLLQVRPELLGEYRARHAAVWPDMLQALHETGWQRYSLFARDDGLLVGYVETDDLAKAQERMAATEVNARWQESMARFFTGLDGRRPDESFLVLDEVFNLDDQRELVASSTEHAGRTESPRS